MTDCIFCHHISKEQILYQSDHFQLVWDIDPIQTGHLLLISKTHQKSLSHLSQEALHDLIETQAYLIKLLEISLPIDGVTIAINDKDLMDSRTHFHVHLIPRRKDDGFWDRIELTKQSFPLENFLRQLK